MNALPILQAFVLADCVYTDAVTRKRVVAGTFGQISASKFPATHPSADAFIMLTEFVGKAPLQLRLVRIKDNLVIMQSGKIEIECEDPLAVVDLAIPIPGIHLPEPGPYCFECYVDGSLIGSVRIMATLLPSGDR